jgi:hypothetical protein
MIRSTSSGEGVRQSLEHIIVQPEALAEEL